jgi:hypothetical protein
MEQFTGKVMADRVGDTVWWRPAARVGDTNPCSRFTSSRTP